MAGKSMLDSSYVVDETPEEPEEPAAPAETPEEPAEEPKPEPLAAKVPIGRRSKAKAAQDELMAELKTLRETVTKQGETYAEKLARIQQENAELRGHMQGYMSRPQQPERPQEKTPDPDELRSQARAALDAKDFDKYERLSAQAVKAEVLRDVLPRIPQQQQAQQANPLLQMVASQYADVVTDRAAFEIAQAHDRILSAQGLPEGPERWKRAFEEGRRYMGSKAKQPQTFSTKTREVLAGVPTRGNGAAQTESAGPGVRLTAHEMSIAKRFKMTTDEYAKHLAAMHPERVEND